MENETKQTLREKVKDVVVIGLWALCEGFALSGADNKTLRNLGYVAISPQTISYMPINQQDQIPYPKDKNHEIYNWKCGRR